MQAASFAIAIAKAPESRPIEPPKTELRAGPHARRSLSALAIEKLAVVKVYARCDWESRVIL